VAIRIHGPAKLICHDDHGVRVWREAARDKEFPHVLDIVDAAFELILRTDVVDSDEEGLATAHSTCAGEWHELLRWVKRHAKSLRKKSNC